MDSNFYAYLLSEVDHSHRYISKGSTSTYYREPNEIKHGFRIFMNNNLTLIQLFLSNYRFLEFNYFFNNLDHVYIKKNRIYIPSIKIEDYLKMIQFYSSYLNKR